jgi:hypothetical protein
MYDDPKEAVFRTYTKVMDTIARQYGVQCPDRRGRECIECVEELVSTVVREQCYVATLEAIWQTLQNVANQTLAGDDDVLFLPECDVDIHSGNVGPMQLRALRVFRTRDRGSAQGA